jgi:uncharacterized membrane protein
MFENRVQIFVMYQEVLKHFGTNMNDDEIVSKVNLLAYNYVIHQGILKQVGHKC